MGGTRKIFALGNIYILLKMYFSFFSSVIILHEAYHASYTARVTTKNTKEGELKEHFLFKMKLNENSVAFKMSYVDLVGTFPMLQLYPSEQ